MTFDKWFQEQSKLVKVILLIIPFVGWVMEILVRLSALLRDTSKTNNILGFVLFLLAGWILQFLDLIFIIVQDKMLLLE